MSAEQSHDPRRWIEYAMGDLSMAERDDVENRHRCFFAQQAAEKMIKAALVHLGVDFPWHHNLNALRDLLPDDWRIRGELPELGELSVWRQSRAIRSRSETRPMRKRKQRSRRLGRWWPR